jgi:hypothetical protein
VEGQKAPLKPTQENYRQKTDGVGSFDFHWGGG